MVAVSPKNENWRTSLSTESLVAASSSYHDYSTLNAQSKQRPRSGVPYPLTFGKNMKMFSFTDNLDIVDDTPIVVRAKITVIPTDQGGRVGPFTKGLRPNHNFGSEDDRFFYIGQIEVPEGEWVYPGDTRELCVTFLNARGLSEMLTLGRTWRIQEGPKLIATGTVIAIE